MKHFTKLILSTIISVSLLQFVNAQTTLIPKPPGYNNLVPEIAFHGFVYCLAQKNTSPNGWEVFKVNSNDNSVTKISDVNLPAAIEVNPFNKFSLFNEDIYFTVGANIYRIYTASDYVSREYNGYSGDGSYIHKNQFILGKIFFASNGKTLIYDPSNSTISTLKYNNLDIDPGYGTQVIEYNNKAYFIAKGNGTLNTPSTRAYMFIYDGANINVTKLQTGKNIWPSTVSDYQIPPPLILNNRIVFTTITVTEKFLTAFDVSNRNFNTNFIDLTYTQGVNPIYGSQTIYKGNLIYSDNYNIYTNDGTIGYLLMNTTITSNISLVSSIVSPNYFNHPFPILNGKIMGTRYTDLNGFELWQSDGTTAGTSLLKDIFPDSYTDPVNAPGVALPNNGFPNSGFVKGNYLYFLGANKGLTYTRSDGSSYSNYLWKTDGTSDGTSIISTLPIQFLMDGGNSDAGLGEYNFVKGVDAQLYKISEGSASITEEGILKSFTACSGTASKEQSIFISGNNLNDLGSILVSAPAGYEISLTAESGYSNSLSISPTGGTVLKVPVYVRLTKTASGSPSGNITCTFPSVSDLNIEVSGTVNISPVKPTISLIQPTISVATGTINITAPILSGLSYSIDGLNYQSSTTFSTVVSGNYLITVKNSSGCISNGLNTTINKQPEAIPLAPSININQPTCTLATGTINVSSPIGLTLSYSIDGIHFQNGTTFPGLTPGTYSVTAKNSAGTSLVTRATINMAPSIPNEPTVSVIQPTCSVLLGSLTVTSPISIGNTYSLDGFLYTNISGTFIGISSGVYPITVKSANGCISNTTYVTITNPIPVTPTISGAASFTVGSSTLLTSSSNTGNQWFLNGNPITGATNNTYSVTTAGNYTVQTKNNDGCKSAFSTIKTIGVNAVSPTSTIGSFAPSTGPAGTLVTLNGTGLSDASSVSIGGVPAIVITKSATKIVAMVMPGAANGLISLFNASGVINSASNFTVTPTPYPNTQQGNKLVARDAYGGLQGSAVSVSADGNTAIVGLPIENGSKGSAVVYTRTVATWTQQGNKLTVTGAAGTMQSLGTSVSISADGNTAVLGAPDDNSGVGAAWVFTRTAGVWSQQGTKLIGTVAVGNARQGSAVSISGDGNTVVVGGIYDNGFKGAVWVFNRTADTWTQVGNKLIGSGNYGLPQMGTSVAISADGKTIIAGGPYDFASRGASWIFTKTGSTWSQQGAKLAGTGTTGNNISGQGTSVALSADGNTAIVGSKYDNAGKGAVWIFTRSSGGWAQQGNKLTGASSIGTANYGDAVGISADGNTAIVGGLNDNPNGNNYTSGKGANWVYTRSGSVWTQQGSKLIGAGATGNASQGFAVALSADGTTAISGAPMDLSGVGAAWVYIYQTPVAPTGNMGTEKSAIVEKEDLTSLQSKEITVYPNPSTGRFMVSFKSPVATTLTLSIVEAGTGRTAYSQSVNAIKGDNQVPVTMQRKQSLSTYILMLEGASMKYENKKLLIDK